MLNMCTLFFITYPLAHLSSCGNWKVSHGRALQVRSPLAKHLARSVAA